MYQTLESCSSESVSAAQKCDRDSFHVCCCLRLFCNIRGHPDSEMRSDWAKCMEQHLCLCNETKHTHKKKKNKEKNLKAKFGICTIFDIFVASLVFSERQFYMTGVLLATLLCANSAWRIHLILSGATFWSKLFIRFMFYFFLMETVNSAANFM